MCSLFVAIKIDSFDQYQINVYSLLSFIHVDICVVKLFRLNEKTTVIHVEIFIADDCKYDYDVMLSGSHNTNSYYAKQSKARQSWSNSTN